MTDASTIRTLVNGARGRMGALICRVVEADSRFALVGARDAGDADPPRECAPNVIIDFSSDAGTRDAIRLAFAHRASIVIGSTGLSSATQRAIEDASRAIAVLVAPNTSLGVAVIAHLAAEAARLLGEGFDIDIIETHHIHKKDAPSGTALRLANAIRATGHTLNDDQIHAIRSGDVVGEHEIRFAGAGERITITHQATNRELFARGAVRAAAYLAGKPAGRYSIEQAMGIGNAETQ